MSLDGANCYSNETAKLLKTFNIPGTGEAVCMSDNCFKDSRNFFRVVIYHKVLPAAYGMSGGYVLYGKYLIIIAMQVVYHRRHSFVFPVQYLVYRPFQVVWINFFSVFIGKLPFFFCNSAEKVIFQGRKYFHRAHMPKMLSGN